MRQEFSVPVFSVPRLAAVDFADPARPAAVLGFPVPVADPAVLALPDPLFVDPDSAAVYPAVLVPDPDRPDLDLAVVVLAAAEGIDVSVHNYI